ncbi:MAG: SRPBCC family protein [Anaerolineales bacterium]|nr:SRPBCC family protein [Anaerolineales bacterium]
MINLHSSTVIYRPVNHIFNFISKAENDFQWQYGTLDSTKVYSSASNVGTVFRSIGHLMGRRVQSTFEVTEYETDRKFGFKSLSGPLHSFTSYTLEMANGSTKVTVSEQANVINFFQVDEAILERTLKKQLKENLALLKSLMEEKRLNSTTEANQK